MSKIVRIFKLIRKWVINGFTALMFATLLTSIAAVDSGSWIPYAGMALSLPWLLLYLAAVGGFDLQDGGDDDDLD